MRILQISDIHFAKEVDGVLDLERELEWRFKEAIEEAAKAGRFDAIVVSGDVAFGGAAEQYARATNFLRDVASLIAVSLDMIFVIPGNHDIDRRLTNVAMQRELRSGLRVSETAQAGDQKLLKALKERADDLVAPLAAYRVFAEQYDCPTSAERPCWDCSLILEDRYELALRGVNSVLASHEYDNESDEALVVGAAQALLEPKHDRAHVVICHHPREWWRWGEGIAYRLDRDAVLQITGHTHDYKLESTPRGAWLRAGSLQPSRKEKGWRPHFAVIDLTTKGGEISIDVEPWAWNDSELRFEAQPSEHEEAAAPDSELTSERRQDLLRGAAERKLMVRAASLAAAEILNAAIGAHLPAMKGDLDDPPSRLAREAVDAARAAGRLPELWDAIHTVYAARGVVEDNPF